MFKVLAFLGLGFGMLIAIWYLKSVQRFIEVIHKKERDVWRSLGQPQSVNDISPLRNLQLVKIILKGKMMSPEAEEARKIVRKRFLIFLCYVVALFIILVVSGVLIATFY